MKSSRRSRSKRNRRRSSTMNASKGAINGLVSSLKKNVKFKGLLKYTIGCISELVTPPNPAVADNANALRKSGGIEILIQALKNHPNDEALLATISTTLERCGVDAKMMKHMAQCDAARAVLDPLQKHPEFVEGRIAAVRLVKKIAHVEATLPDLVSQGVTQSIVGVLGTAAFLKNDEVDVGILTDASVTLSRLVNHEDAISSLMNENDVGVLIGVLGSNAAKRRDVASKFLKPVFRVMQKIGSSDEGLALLKRLGGIDSLLAAMEANPDDLSLLKAGASVLDKLVSVKDLEEALRVLADANSSARAKQLAATMVGNLALTGNNLETITNAGGVQSLLAILETADSPGLVEAAARALGRLATTAENVDALIADGGITRLLDLIRNNVDQDGVVSAVDGALTNIAHFMQGATAIDEANGILVVVWALESHPEFTLAPHSAVRFFNMVMSTLGTKGADTLLKDNMVLNVGRALQARPENEVLAASGASCFRTIITLLGCADKVVEAGAIETSIDALGRFASSIDTSVLVLQLLYSLSFEASSRAQMVQGGIISPAALVAKQHIENTRVIHAVVELLSRIVDVDEIKRAVANVLEESRNVGQGRVKDATALDNLILSVVKLDVYAMIPKCMTWLVSNKAPEAVVSMLSSTVSARPDDVFEQSSILEATLQTLNSIAKSEKRANTSVCGLSTKAVANVLKKFAEYPDALSEAAQLICTLAKLPGNVPTLRSASMSKYLIGAAKNNPSHVELQKRVAQALELMAISGDSAATITRAGAARVLLTSVSDMDSCDAPSARCAEAVLNLVSTLADFTDSQKALKGQSIVTVLCSVAHKFGWDPDVSSAARQPLSLVSDMSDANVLMTENVHEIDLVLDQTQLASAMCLVDNFSSEHSQSAANAFVQIIETCNASDERYLQTSAATLGLSWLANDFQLNDRQDLILPLVESLNKWTGSEILTCRSLIAVSAFAGNPDSLATLLDVGVVPAIVNAMGTATSKDVVTMAGMRAMTELSKTPQGCGNVVNRGGVDVIFKELEACVNAERMGVCLNLIATICASDDLESARQLLDNPKTLPLIVNGLQTFPRSSIVQASTMSAMSHMIDEDWKREALFKTKGLIEALTFVLDEERKDRADVVIGALQIIGAIVSNNANNASSCKVKGVDNSILNAMTRYPTHVALLARAAEALAPMTTSEDITMLIEDIKPMLSAVQADDQRVATLAERLLRKLANLSYVEGIMSGMDVASIAQVLLNALAAGDSLTAQDVRGPYLGACVGAMAGLANCGGLSSEALAPLVSAVVASLQRALATPGANTAVLQCTSSCALMAKCTEAAQLMVNEPHNMVSLNMQVLDNAGNDKFLTFAGLTLLSMLAKVDGAKVSAARSVEQCASLMRHHFAAVGVLLAGCGMLDSLISSYAYAPMISEGGISIGLEVLESACTKRQHSLVASALTLLASTVTSLPANQTALSSNEALVTLKHVFGMSLTNNELVTMTSSTNVLTGTTLGNVGDVAVTRLLAMGAHEMMMKALAMHTGDETFVCAALAFLGSLLERDEGQRAIDKEAAEALFQTLRDIYGENGAVFDALTEATAKLSATKVATDEMVIEAIRTYASYYPHFPTRPDLASHLDKLANELAIYAKNDRHADLIQEDGGLNIFMGALTLMGDEIPDVENEFVERENILARTSDAIGRIERIRPGTRPVERVEVVQRMLVHLRVRYMMGDLAEASLGCLVSLCNNTDNCKGLYSMAGLDLIIDSTQRHPGRPGLQKNSALLIAILAGYGVPDIANKLVELGMTEILLTQLTEEDQSAELVALRFAALEALAQHGTGVAERIIANGGIASVVTAMWNNGSSADVAAAGMSLLSSCSDALGFAEALKASNGVDVVLALMTTHAFDGRVGDAAASVLSRTCSAADVQECMDSLRAMIDAGDSTGASEMLNRLANLMAVDAFHSDKGMIAKIAAMVEEAMQAFPDSDHVNNAGLRALAELAKRDAAMAAEFIKDGVAFNYAFDVLKTDATNISRMLPALALLEQCAGSHVEGAQTMVDNGAIGALLNAIRMNVSNPVVQCRSVDVLGTLGKSLGVAAFLEAGGLRALLEALEVANKHETNSVATRVLTVLNDLASNDRDFADAFLNSRGMDLLNETMEIFQNEENVLVAVAALMKTLGEMTGSLEKIFSSKTYKKLVQMMNLHPEMEKLATNFLALMNLATNDKKLLDLLAQNGSIAAVQGIMGLHTDCKPIVEACDAIMEASGNADFQDMTATEATEQLRQAIANNDSNALRRALKTIGQLAVLDSGAKGEMIDTLGTFTDVIGVVGDMDPPFDMQVMNAAVGAMEQMPMNEMTIKLMLDTNSISKLLEAMRQNPNDIELLLKVVRVLGRMSINDQLKNAIVGAGGIELVLWCMGAHQAEHFLMTACCTALANFAFNSFDVAVAIVKQNGVPIIENVMQVNATVHRVLANALQVLSNLMFKNDDHKLLICERCGDEIVHMIRLHYANVSVFQSGLRALGTLVYCEENCPIIVGEGATRVIVDGMRAHWDDGETVQLAINVIENLASENVPVSEAPDSVGKEHHPIRHGEDSLSVIHAEGAGHVVLQAIQKFEFNPSLIMSAIDALLNIVDDETLMEQTIRDGAIPIIMEALRGHDWDMDLVSSILNLLVMLSNRSDQIASKIEMNNGSELCGAVMDNFPDNSEIVTHACMLLANIANADSNMIPKIGEQGIVDILLSILNEKQANAGFIMEPLHLLAVLSGDSSICKTIASKGMHSICSAAKTHMSNPNLLLQIHKLLGFLAFVPETLRDIVQHDGPCMIIETICNNPESRDMVLQAIGTIDVLCMSDAEHRDICVNEGAEECVNVVMDTYESDLDIVDACKSTLLSIRVNAKNVAARRESTIQIKKKISSGKMRLSTMINEADELKAKIDLFRHKLLAGNMMTKHHKSNNPRKRHIVITSDLRMIGWKEASSKGAFKGTLQLNEVTAVEAGAVTKSLRRRYFMGTNPKPDCCFAIHARTRTLDLECGSRAQRDEWVEMLNLLLKYRKAANMN